MIERPGLPIVGQRLSTAHTGPLAEPCHRVLSVILPGVTAIGIGSQAPATFAIWDAIQMPAVR